jgi:4'-phosphopantetheinyl transferase
VHECKRSTSISFGLAYISNKFVHNRYYTPHCNKFAIAKYLSAMPLFAQWTISATAIAAIWKIEEPEAFFQVATGMHPAIAAPKRRQEYLAARFLLQWLQPELPITDIAKDIHHKPRLPDDTWRFSISHAWPYVAVVVDTHAEAGIDIETWRPSITKIKDKFLAPTEQALLAHSERNMLLAWCAKEAAYKWNGRREVAFIEHLPMQTFTPEPLTATIHLPLSGSTVQLKGIANAEFACLYVSNCI